MKISKQARRDAKQIFRGCQVKGVIDEAKARLAVRALVERKPRGYLGILSHFQRLVQLDVDRRSATVISAVPLTQTAQDRVESTLSARYGVGLSFNFKTDPAVIGGLKVKVGSDVFDGTVRARLESLGETF